MINPEEMRAKMKIPPQLKPTYLKLVAAGMKVMFSNETNHIMMEQLQSNPDIVKAISEGIAGLMAILFKRYKGTPAQLMVPVALDLVTQAIDFVTKTKFAVLTKEQVGATISATIDAVLTKFGVQPEQAMQQLQSAAAKSKAGIVQGSMQ